MISGKKDFTATYKFKNAEGFDTSRTIVISAHSPNSALVEIAKLMPTTVFNVKVAEDQV